MPTQLCTHRHTDSCAALHAQIENYCAHKDIVHMDKQSFLFNVSHFTPPAESDMFTSAVCRMSLPRKKAASGLITDPVGPV